MGRRNRGPKGAPAPAIKVVVATPCRREVHAGYAVDLVQLVQTPVPGLEALAVLLNTGTLIHRTREQQAEAALKAEATHVLWIDSDMRFPPDALRRLLAHQLPIVGANCVSRHADDLTSTSRRFTSVGKDHQVVATGPESNGLEEVTSTGFGLILVETSVLRTLPRPWFWYGFTEYGQPLSEDDWFCLRAGEAGFSIYVDHDVSKEVKHVGEVELTCCDHGKVP